MEKTYYKATITNIVDNQIILYKIFIIKAELDAWLQKISTVPIPKHLKLNIYQQTLDQQDIRTQ